MRAPRAPTRRSLLTALAVLALVYLAVLYGSDVLPRLTEEAIAPASGDAAVEEAFGSRRSDVIVELAGRVERLLRDDREGSRHQKFILRLDSGRTLLISHNIDLAPRVPIETGDRVELRGEYEWNARGGLVHWTHHDPQGRRPGGWIRHAGEIYD